MAIDVNDIDFEGNGQNTNVTSQNNNQGNNGNNIAEDVTQLNGTPDIVDINKSTNVDNSNNADNNNGVNVDKNTTNSNDNVQQTPSTGGLTEGDRLEVDGVTYTIDANGNVVDEKGVIFKEAKDVNEWLKEYNDVAETNEELSVNAIQEALGVSITDEKGKPVEFTNDAEGVKAYVNSVIELKSNEIRQAAINKLYSDNPLLKQFVDYVQVTGTPRGFGDIPDRSGIEVDKDNIQQQEYIIRMAASEFGNKSLNDTYIKYLKDTGGLYDEAVNQLKALSEKDVAVRKQIEKDAEAKRIEEEKSLAAYWDNVKNVITSRKVAGYKLPETIVKEVNGQKVTLTPNDFYNYLSKQVSVDENGVAVTGYQRDLNNLNDSDLLNRELLDAWLMFTGGSYKDLVDMAIKEEQVRVLKLKSKEARTNKTVKVVKAKQDKVDINDILLS